MRGLTRRRVNILRLVKRHKEYLTRRGLDKRTPEEVFLWLVAYSSTLEKRDANVLGLWFGFGSLYQTATVDNPGVLLHGHQICQLLGEAFTWAKFAKVRDRLLLTFALQLRDQKPRQDIGEIYCYQPPPKVSKYKQAKSSGVQKLALLSNTNNVHLARTTFAWPVRC